MAKEPLTALVVARDRLEWQTLAGTREHPAPGGAGRVPLAPSEPPAKAEEGGEAAGDLPDEVRAALSAIRGEVTLALQSEDVLMRVIRLPGAAPEELPGMVELQVDKLSPFPIESMTVSHEVLSRGEGECTVLIGAVRNDVLTRMGDLVGKAGIRPVRVDAEILGWWRVLRDAGEIHEKGHHIVVIADGPSMDVLVFQDGVPAVFRTLQGLDGLADPAHAAEAAREVRMVLMSLDIGRGPRRSRALALWHRGESPAALAGALSGVCDCEAVVKSLDGLPSSAMGVARRSADAGDGLLDLTPPAWRAERLSGIFRRRFLKAAVAVLAVWLVLVGGFWGLLSYQRSRAAAAKSEREKWRGPAEEVYDLRQRVVAISRYLSQTNSALECLRQISMIKQPGADLTLTSFSYQKGEQLVLSGEATSVELVYQFKTQLDGVFGTTELKGVSREERRKKELFEIIIKLPGGEA